jgi:hypothetical protein
MVDRHSAAQHNNDVLQRKAVPSDVSLRDIADPKSRGLRQPVEAAAKESSSFGRVPSGHRRPQTSGVCASLSKPQRRKAVPSDVSLRDIADPKRLGSAPACRFRSHFSLDKPQPK